MSTSTHGEMCKLQSRLLLASTGLPRVPSSFLPPWSSVPKHRAEGKRPGSDVTSTLPQAARVAALTPAARPAQVHFVTCPQASCPGLGHCARRPPGKMLKQCASKVTAAKCNLGPGNPRGIPKQGARGHCPPGTPRVSLCPAPESSLPLSPASVSSGETTATIRRAALRDKSRCRLAINQPRGHEGSCLMPASVSATGNLPRPHRVKKRPGRSPPAAGP